MKQIDWSQISETIGAIIILAIVIGAIGWIMAISMIGLLFSVPVIVGIGILTVGYKLIKRLF